MKTYVVILSKRHRLYNRVGWIAGDLLDLGVGIKSAIVHTMENFCESCRWSDICELNGVCKLLDFPLENMTRFKLKQLREATVFERVCLMDKEFRRRAS